MLLERRPKSNQRVLNFSLTTFDLSSRLPHLTFFSTENDNSIKTITLKTSFVVETRKGERMKTFLSISSYWNEKSSTWLFSLFLYRTGRSHRKINSQIIPPLHGTSDEGVVSRDLEQSFSTSKGLSTRNLVTSDGRKGRWRIRKTTKKRDRKVSLDT